jgi:hypothetical protein
MSEFDRLRALLDNVAVGDSAVPAARAPGSRRWTRALWTVLAIVTTLDALYLLVKALPLR